MTSASPPRLPRPRRARDGAAFAGLVSEHGGAVYALCRRLASEPDDAYQEIWEKVHLALPRFDAGGRAGVGAWIRTIARRHLIDRHRRAVVRRSVNAPLPEPAPEPLSRDRGPEAALHDARRAARLEAALARLPAPQRRVVVLHHAGGVPLADLAADEGVPVGTLKSRLHRGRARLAELLGEP